MGRHFAAALISLWGLAFAGGGATAMQFEPVQMATSDVLIVGRGPIVHGDFDRFTRALATLSQGGHPLAALALDSAGGNVMEARQLVAVIRERRMTVVLPHNTQCASACFLLFAASPRRLAATDALVGVHSASIDGGETDASLAVTTLMARDARDLGVPPAIVGKMVETTPGRVEWLSPEDLRSMKVTLFEGDLTSALHQQQTQTVASAAVAPPVAPAATTVQPRLPASPNGATGEMLTGAALGRADRWNIEDWIAGLRGEYRDGAEFARTRFPETRPADCYGPNNVNRGDFTLGCMVAQQRLSLIVQRIRADQDYASGWNTVPGNTAAADGPVEQEYLGVYFCASQVAQLNVKIFRRSGGDHGRALIAFGPRGSDPNVQRGSFMAEGTINTAAGAISISPVKWVSQPPNALWFGINGGSDDGGKTFIGRVTDNPACTRFTLARRQAGAPTR
jgi:hypothetical protein